MRRAVRGHRRAQPSRADARCGTGYLRRSFMACGRSSRLFRTCARRSRCRPGRCSGVSWQVAGLQPCLQIHLEVVFRAHAVAHLHPLPAHHDDRRLDRRKAGEHRGKDDPRRQPLPAEKMEKPRLRPETQPPRPPSAGRRGGMKMPDRKVSPSPRARRAIRAIKNGEPSQCLFKHHACGGRVTGRGAEAPRRQRRPPASCRWSAW